MSLVHYSAYRLMVECFVTVNARRLQNGKILVRASRSGRDLAAIWLAGYVWGGIWEAWRRPGNPAAWKSSVDLACLAA
jgi:hypothetical protein